MFNYIYILFSPVVSNLCKMFKCKKKNTDNHQTPWHQMNNVGLQIVLRDQKSKEGLLMSKRY